MAHKTPAIPPAPSPRPDLTLAQDCKLCHEWGTVVTLDCHHELCPACQHPTSEDIDPQSPEDSVDPRVQLTVTLKNP
ncbi:hypothetical protein [Streptomyces coeruleorubidus]|uniref:hypothetical protein n=1 Tax=Streptomyces coeruleorubidus TaxID=116188 RepID=UPI00365E122C